MATAKSSLKEPGVCRVFFSSPFNGMEGEREELTRRYWPQLSSLCSSHGLQFVPVDMRWGITSEMSDNAQTINICLREIDRSDIFVGFFGQRYGWHGENNATLQTTFDAAVSHYPWLDSERSKSVTELEFLHGHLRHPGQLPAVICFRDKAYDDKERAKGVEKNDKRTIYKFSSESEKATQMMDDLKARVEESREKGARLMFEAVWNHLTEVLLHDIQRPDLTQFDEMLLHHEALCDTHCSLYFGREQNFSDLNVFISKDTSGTLVVEGPAGYGKSALLCNWIRQLQRAAPDTLLLYHFVGCTAESCDKANILRVLLWRLLQHESTEGSTSKQKADEVAAYEFSALVRHWQQYLKQVTDSGTRVIVVIDGLNRMKEEAKDAMPLFWLPKDLPAGTHVVLSTQMTDTDHLTELQEHRSADTLHMEQLDNNTMQTMCKEVLQLYGKGLSPHQLDMVITSQQCSNPLFLRIVLDELCLFGKFRELDTKIQSLIDSASAKDLLIKYVQRLEEDNQHADFAGNIVEQVLCSLHVSVHGLSEQEVCECVGVPSHLWSQLYYGLKKHLISQNGHLFFVYQELGEAVEEKYELNEQKRNEFMIRICDFYLEKTRKSDGPLLLHMYLEPLHLAQQMKDNTRLLSLLTRPEFFKHQLSQSRYSLLAMVQDLKLSGEQIVAAFRKGILIYMCTRYCQSIEDWIEHPNAGQTAIEALVELCGFLYFARMYEPLKSFLHWQMEILEINHRMDSAFHDATLLSCRYRLACVSVDLREYAEGLELHQLVIAGLESQSNLDSGKLDSLCCSYHGIATAYQGLKDYDKAAEFYEKSLQAAKKRKTDFKVDNEVRLCNTYSQLAQLQALRGNHTAAIEVYKDVIEMESRLNFGLLTPEMSYPITNLAIVYRQAGQLDLAEEACMQALEIKQKTLGFYHTDVAKAFVNVANLLKAKENYTLVEEKLNQALDILKHLEQEDSTEGVLVKENLMMCYMDQHGRGSNLGKWEDQFWDIFNQHEAQGTFDISAYVIHDEYIRYFAQTGQLSSVLRMARAYIPTSLCRAVQYYLLAIIHYQKMLPEEGNCPQPEHEMISAGLKKFPDSDDLVRVRVDFELIPSQDEAGVLHTLDEYYTASCNTSEQMAILVLDLCEGKGWSDGYKAVLEWAVDRMPNETGLLRNLGMLRLKAGEHAKALTLFQRAYSIDPSQMVVLKPIFALSVHLQQPQVQQWVLDELEKFDTPEAATLLEQFRNSLLKTNAE